MSDLNAKLARQQQAIEATKTSIAKLSQLVKTTKDEAFRINGNLIIAQLNNKLRRQIVAANLTTFQLDLKL